MTIIYQLFIKNQCIGAVLSPNGYIITIPFQSHGTIDVWDKNNNCVMQIMAKRTIFYACCL